MSDSQFQDISKSFIKGSSFQKEMIVKNEQIKLMHEEINGLAQIITEMKSEMKRSVQQVEKNRETVRQVTRNELRLSKKILECEDEKEKLKNEFQDSQKRYKELLDAMMKEKADQLEISQNLEGNIAGYEEKIKYLEESGKKKEQKVFILLKEAEQQEKKITELSEENQNLTSRIEQLKLTNSKLLKQLADQQAPSSAIKQKLNHQVKDLEKLLKQKMTENHFQHQKIHFQEELTQLNAKIINYEEEKKKLLGKINTQIQMIVQKDEEYKDLSKLYHQALDEQTKNQGEIAKVANLNKKVAEMMTENCSLGVQNENLNKIISVLNENLLKLQDQKKNLNKDLSEATKQLEALKKDTRNLSQEMFELQRTNQRHLQLELSRLRQEFQNERVAMKLHQEELRKKFSNQEEKPQQYTLEQLQKTARFYIVQILQKIEHYYSIKEEQKFMIKFEIDRVKQTMNQLIGEYMEMCQPGQDNKMGDNHVGNKKFMDKKPCMKHYKEKQKK